MADRFQIDVNGEWTFELDRNMLHPFDMARLAPDAFHVLKDHQPYEVRLVRSDFNRKGYQLMVNGKPYSVQLSDDLDQLISKMGFKVGTASTISRIEAPMPGLILEIRVSGGDEVREGDPLLVLEAMKMENMILSPRDGVIKNIHVAKGAAVDKKDLLVEFE